MERIHGWLGVTRQQFGIIEAVANLQKRGEVASPKAIVEEDSGLRGAPRIQKSNFFAQLKNLQNRGYVKKLGDASYGVDFEAIRHALDEREASIEGEIEELHKAKEHTKRYFMQDYGGEKKPMVAFYEYDEMYNKLVSLIRRNDSYYAITIFPRILYANSPSLLHSPAAMRYSQALWNHCFQAQDLEVVYLSCFDMEYLFDKLFSSYKNATNTYEEIKLILANVENLINNSGKFRLYYSEHSYNVGTIMPYANEPSEFFLMLRDVESKGRGSVYINSPELAFRFKNLFKDDCEEALDMSSKKGASVLKKLGNQLDRIYARYSKKEEKEGKGKKGKEKKEEKGGKREKGEKG